MRVVNDSATFVGTAYSQALSDEIDVLGANDILFVTAAGNTGDNNDNPSVRRYPCGYDRPNEICVTASDQNDRLPTWANYGATTVDLAAPGNNVYSTLRSGTYGYVSGGSMASPQVAGAAALILAAGNQTTSALRRGSSTTSTRCPRCPAWCEPAGGWTSARRCPAARPPSPRRSARPPPARARTPSRPIASESTGTPSPRPARCRS